MPDGINGFSVGSDTGSPIFKPLSYKKEEKTKNKQNKENESYTFAQILDQRSETRRQLLSEIRKTNDIISTSTMPSIKALAEKHLMKLQADLEIINHAPEQLSSIQELVSPVAQQSSGDEVYSDDYIMSQKENFETIPLSPQNASNEGMQQQFQSQSYSKESYRNNSISPQMSPNAYSHQKPHSKSIRFSKNTQITPSNEIDQCKSFPPYRKETFNKQVYDGSRFFSTPTKKEGWKQVMAPNNLPGGYRFQARLGDTSFIATVVSFFYHHLLTVIIFSVIYLLFCVSYLIFTFS